MQLQKYMVSGPGSSKKPRDHWEALFSPRQVETDAEGKTRAVVKMTLTAPGCGMGPTIAADAQSRIMTIEDMDDAAVELVWDPAWNQGMISIEGKMKLGMI